MANIHTYWPKLKKWEGGYSNHPNDAGGATNMGVTLSTWRAVGFDIDGDGDIDAEDIKKLGDTEAMMVLKNKYWNMWKADHIENQSVAELVVDWYWGSGSYGIKIPQSVIGVKPDGIVGGMTIAAINKADQQILHDKIWHAHEDFFNNIVRHNPSQKVFLKGWMNRLNDFKFHV